MTSVVDDDETHLRELVQGLSEHQRVYIEKGANKNKRGIVVCRKDRRTVTVRLEDGSEINVFDSSVRILHEQPLFNTHRGATHFTLTEPIKELVNNCAATFQRHQYSKDAVAQNLTTTTLATKPSDVGEQVSIIKGTHKGSLAIIVRLKDRRTYTVKILSTGQEVGVRVSSVVSLCSSERDLSFQTSTCTANKSNGLQVATSLSSAHLSQDSHLASRIVSNPEANNTFSMVTGAATDTYNKIVCDAIRNRSATRLESETSAAERIVDNNYSNLSGDCTQGSSPLFRRMKTQHGSGMTFGGYRIKKVRVDEEWDDNEAKKSGITFLQYSLGDRLVCIERPMKGSKQKRYDKSIVHNGRTCELISVRIEDDKAVGSIYRRPKVAQLFYVDTSNCIDGTSFSVRKFLSQIGDFSVLDPRKVAARLELFHSPARFPIMELEASDCRDIDEQGNVGCGFIQDEFLHRICRENGFSTSAAALVGAVQVRLFIPSMGIYKGMLQRKRIMKGPRIHLPPSMKKVPASTLPWEISKAYLVVCQAGIHPSPGSANDFIGRRLDPSRPPPPERSFTAKIQKPLSNMVLDLWKSVNVPEDELKKYKRESMNTSRRNHAWVVGVADPTGGLPTETIFIPGMVNEHLDKIFVTRSPCLRHDHGRLLQTVQHKPKEMSEEYWNELQLLPFGSIIFSRPRPGSMTIPERIAHGDLDGDLYLICWDTVILSHMTDVEPMKDLSTDDEGVIKLLPPNPNWLEDAYEIMTESTLLNEIGDLIGELYKQSESSARCSDLGKRDPDALAFAEAFNDALEYKKHGRPIRLPPHLLCKIRQTRHHLIEFE